MKCIWCKQNSDSSKSIEHIIPESLGNQKHTLPRGWVCDQCNNYFSRKVEHPFLDSSYGQAIRFELEIPNKRKRIPPLTGVHLESGMQIEATRNIRDNALSIGILKESDVEGWEKIIDQDQIGTLIFPVATLPENNRILSRFIAKMAYEILANKCIEIKGWNEEIVNQLPLEGIRQYVRFNTPQILWPIHIRQLYIKDKVFTEHDFAFQVLNEYDILITKDLEYFVVIAIFGVEYTLNIVEPDLDGYVKWLSENDNKSPLYWKEKTSGEFVESTAYFK